MWTYDSQHTKQQQGRRRSRALQAQDSHVERNRSNDRHFKVPVPWFTGDEPKERKTTWKFDRELPRIGAFKLPLLVLCGPIQRRHVFVGGKMVALNTSVGPESHQVWVIACAEAVVMDGSGIYACAKSQRTVSKQSANSQRTVSETCAQSHQSRPQIDPNIPQIDPK